MRKLAALLVLPLVGALAIHPLAASAAGEPSVGAPYVYGRAILGSVTVRPTQLFRIESGGADVPDATGPENRSFDVQVSRTPMRSARPRAWQDRFLESTDRRFRLRVAPGEITCVRARQHSWDATSDWSERQCVIRALDDRQVAARGPVRSVRDDLYADAHATYLRPGSSLRLPKIRRAARYGVVFTEYPLSSPRWCVHPDIYLAGQSRPRGYTGAATNKLTYLYSTAHAPGVAVFGSSARSTCHVGGVVVVPAWMR